MKWITEGPKVGEKKTVRRFAWLPVRVNENTVWWETYEVTYILRLGLFNDYYWSETSRSILVDHP